MIRFAAETDIDNIVKMIRDDCNEIGYSFNEQYVAEQVRLMVANQCLLFVHEKGGVIGAIIGQNMFDPTIYEMRVFLWYADIALSPMGRGRVMVQLLDHLLSLSSDKRMDFHCSLPVRGKGQAMGAVLEGRNFNIEETYYILRR